MMLNTMPTFKWTVAGTTVVGIFLVSLLLATFKAEAPTQAPPEQNKLANTRNIGHSTEGREITAYTFGSGDTNLLFVGGIHGGYEWNTIVLAEEMIAAITRGEIPVPEKVTVHIIPNLNPDGVHKALGIAKGFTAADELAVATTSLPAGRFNANNVDLNRNFDCMWKATSTWRGQSVSAGSQPFSEPESTALRDYIYMINPRAVVFWHSRGGSVYTSGCEGKRVGTTKTLMQQYARAAGYDEVLDFTAYPISGDAESWLASIGIPAITVELGSRSDSEWEKNEAGVQAILGLYGSIEE
jgi:predicted deacylase